MLREIKPVRQHPGEFRRLFLDDFFDLYVWYESEESQEHILGFQLCYDKGNRERALTWLRGEGMRHSWVDSGDDSPKANRTPTLIHGCIDDFAWLLSIFQERSTKLPESIASLVAAHLTAIPQE